MFLSILWSELRRSLSTIMLTAWVFAPSQWVICSTLYLLTVALTSRQIREPAGDLLLRRYYLLRLPFFRAFLHQMHAHDTGRHSHSHPWTWARALVVTGGYLEFRSGTPDTYRWLSPGDVNVLNPGDYHRIEDVRSDTWTLFCAGTRRSDWGFLTPSGHIDWRDYAEWQRRNSP